MAAEALVPKFVLSGGASLSILKPDHGPSRMLRILKFLLLGRRPEEAGGFWLGQFSPDSSLEVSPIGSKMNVANKEDTFIFSILFNLLLIYHVVCWSHRRVEIGN